MHRLPIIIVRYNSICYALTSSLHLFSENVESKYLKSEKPKKVKSVFTEQKTTDTGKKSDLQDHYVR